jgi:hypothetical protein
MLSGSDCRCKRDAMATKPLPKAAGYHPLGLFAYRFHALPAASITASDKLESILRPPGTVRRLPKRALPLFYTVEIWQRYKDCDRAQRSARVLLRRSQEIRVTAAARTRIRWSTRLKAGRRRPFDDPVPLIQRSSLPPIRHRARAGDYGGRGQSRGAASGGPRLNFPDAGCHPRIAIMTRACRRRGSEATSGYPFLSPRDVYWALFDIYSPFIGVHSSRRDGLHLRSGYTNQQVGGGVPGSGARDGHAVASRGSYRCGCEARLTGQTRDGHRRRTAGAMRKG